MSDILVANESTANGRNDAINTSFEDSLSISSICSTTMSKSNEMSSNADSLSQGYTKLERKIHKEFDMLAISLENRKNELLEQLRKIHDTKQSELSASFNINDSNNNLYSIDSIEPVDFEFDPREFDSVFAQLNTTINNYGKLNETNQLNQTNSRDDDSSMSSTLTNLSTMNEIHPTSNAHAECKISGDGLSYCFLDEETSFEISFKPNGNPSAHRSNVSFLDVFICPAEKPLSNLSAKENFDCKLESISDGLYLVKYKLNQVAMYKLNILVNKVHVGQSPYLIKCLERAKPLLINSKTTSASHRIFDFKPNAVENQTKIKNSKSLHFNQSRMDTSSPIPPENNQVKHSALCPSHSSSRLNAKNKLTNSHSSNESILSNCSFTSRNKSVPLRDSFFPNKINHSHDDFVFQIGKHGRGKAEFMNPQAVCATHSRIYITDSNNQKVDVFTLTGEYKSSFDTNEGVKIMRRPVGIDWQSNGNILVVDYEYKCVNVFTETGKFHGRICQNKLLGPKGICINRAHRNQIIIADSKANSIFVFDAEGRFLHKFGQLGYKNENFSGPQYVACMSNGDILVTDFYNHCIKVFDPNGKFKLSFGSNGSNNGQFNGPTGLVTDKYDNVIVVDWGNSRIQVFDKYGQFVKCVNTELSGLYGPQDVSLINDSLIAVADSGNHCIKVYKYKTI